VGIWARVKFQRALFCAYTPIKWGIVGKVLARAIIYRGSESSAYPPQGAKYPHGVLISPLPPRGEGTYAFLSRGSNVPLTPHGGAKFINVILEIIGKVMARAINGFPLVNICQ